MTQDMMTLRALLKPLIDPRTVRRRAPMPICFAR